MPNPKGINQYSKARTGNGLGGGSRVFGVAKKPVKAKKESTTVKKYIAKPLKKPGAR